MGSITDRLELDGDSTEHWLKTWWRPAMAIQYIMVCIMDFIGFPALTFLLTPTREWHPLTLQGGGLYHLSMGAIIGVTAWRRTDEKMLAYGSSEYTRRTDSVDPSPVANTSSPRSG